MAKNKKSKTKRTTAEAFTYASLHPKVLDAVSDSVPSAWFHEGDNDNRCSRKWSSFVMGSFKCAKGSCKQSGWFSGRVAILIRGYDGNGYNAVVFNQSCKSCRELGILMLDEQSYVDRVARRLKVWAGIKVKAMNRPRKEMPPHKSDLCEGCKRGICKYAPDHRPRQKMYNQTVL